MPEVQGLGLPFVNREQLDFKHGTSFRLSLDLCSAVNCTVEIRGFTKSGPFTFKIVHTGSDTGTSYNRAIPDIPIMASVTLASGAPIQSTIFAALHLDASNDRTVLLASGNINGLYGIAWPQQVNPTDVQQNGIPELKTIGNTTLFTEAYATVPANQVWEILGCRFTITSTADVGNRNMTLMFTNTTIIFFAATSPSAQTASQSVGYGFYVNATSLGFTDNTAGIYKQHALPMKLYAHPGYRVQIKDYNELADDAIANINIIIRRHWLNPSLS